MAIEEVAGSDISFVCRWSAVEEVSGQTVHARRWYTAPDIRWNMRFADIMSPAKDGERSSITGSSTIYCQLRGLWRARWVRRWASWRPGSSRGRALPQGPGPTPQPAVITRGLCQAWHWLPRDARLSGAVGPLLNFAADLNAGLRVVAGWPIREIAAILVCLVVSAFFSAAETSLTALSEARTRQLAEKRKVGLGFLRPGWSGRSR